MLSLEHPKNVAKIFGFMGIGSAIGGRIGRFFGSRAAGAAGDYVWGAICGIVGGKVGESKILVAKLISAAVVNPQTVPRAGSAASLPTKASVVCSNPTV
ncbi:hypothetical protein AC1031_010028 [Aphanomyces cochlioides]|nr:hypothetical protein AC1031_010028 [Aphanomyces cochlioides]